MSSDEEAPRVRTIDPLDWLRRHPRSRRIAIGCVIAAILLTAILIALPIGVAWYAEGWLRDNGATAAHIDDVDINLFTGVVRISGVNASGGQRERLNIGSAELNVRWWPLVSRRVHVESLRLADAQVDVRAGQGAAWRFGALSIAPAESGSSLDEGELSIKTGDPSSWGFGSGVVQVSNVTVTYRDTTFDTEVDVREVLVGSHFTWDTGRTTDLVVDLSVDGSPLVFRSDIQPWAEQRRLAGSLKLNELNVADYGQALQELVGLGEPRGSVSLNLDLTASYDAYGVAELRITGPLEVSEIGFTLDNIAFANQTLRWEGEVALQLPAPEDGTMLQLDGTVQLAGTRAALADIELETELANLDWTGTIMFSPPKGPEASSDLAIRSALTASGFRLDHVRLPFTLATLEKFNLTNIEVNGVEQFSARQLQLQGLRLLGEPPGGEPKQPDALSLEQLEMNGLSFDASRRLTADSLSLRAPKVSLVRNEQGEFSRIADVLLVFSPNGAADDAGMQEGEPAEPATEPSPSLQFAVADIQVTAEELLSFEDRAVAPPTRLTLSTMDLGVKNFDSAGDRPMDIRLVASDDNMKLTADGTVDAFAEALAADLAIQITALDLPRISPYVPGFNIERGRFSADSSVMIKADAVEVQNALRIDKLKLSSKAAEGNAPLAQGMAMPLDVALDLLRDSNDRIEIELPISGSLADPKFGTGDIVRAATQKALQNAAMSYVKSALQPLGTLMLVGKIASQVSRPRFVPVPMAPGDSSLTANGRDYLQKLGALLNERPGLQLTICGVATPADRQALATVAIDSPMQEAVDGLTDEVPPQNNAAEPEIPATETTGSGEPVVTDSELLQLAELRTAAVIDFLVDEEAVERERLFACRATIERSDEESPRVEISL